MKIIIIGPVCLAVRRALIALNVLCNPVFMAHRTSIQKSVRTARSAMSVFLDDSHVHVRSVNMLRKKWTHLAPTKLFLLEKNLTSKQNISATIVHVSFLKCFLFKNLFQPDINVASQLLSRRLVREIILTLIRIKRRVRNVTLVPVKNVTNGLQKIILQ